MTLAADRPVPDSQPRTWVDHMPQRMRPFLRLARYDRPIGFWLLALPCWMGQLLSQTGAGLGWDDLQLAVLFAAGSVAMRGAGCTYNDIVDRDLDARVERTAHRPLPAGSVTLRGAWLFLLAQCLAGFIILVQLPPLAIWIALAALVLVAAYPFMKRITWWPQAWLGLTFNWGVLVAYAAVADRIDPAALMLYGACVFWTLGYDTIYACQDMEDDALVGVRSTARRLARGLKRWLWGFYGAAAAMTAFAILLTSPTPWVIIPFCLYAFHLFDQITRVSPSHGAVCLDVFRSNRTTGMLLVLTLAVGALI